MLTIIVATVIALSLACLVLIKSRVADPTQLDQQRPALLTMGVQIICGDCSGEGDKVVKTYLNRHGSCSQCGGNSYLLASAVGAGFPRIAIGGENRSIAPSDLEKIGGPRSRGLPFFLVTG